MILEAAKVLDSLGIGYAILHGSLSGKERKESLAKFQNDDACRVFLSTDAGGTGLNLQHADTVVNLELPWNPAVLEQRIARVHRMGQNRPVRVINFVTRGTIEERVQKAIEAKQGLFNGLFAGDEDEIAFESTGASKFLDAMRGLLNENPPVPVESASATVSNAPRPTGLWSAAGHMIDGLADLVASSRPVPDEIKERLKSLLEKMN
jgi:superfamily II DNA/RNA helicase